MKLKEFLEKFQSSLFQDRSHCHNKVKGLKKRLEMKASYPKKMFQSKNHRQIKKSKMRWTFPGKDQEAKRIQREKDKGALHLILAVAKARGKILEASENQTRTEHLF